MAYDSNNHSAMSYANGFTIFNYKTPDRAYDVTVPGYFPKHGMLRAGDFVFLNANFGGEIESGILLVTATSPVVKVHPMTPIVGSADTSPALPDQHPAAA